MTQRAPSAEAAPFRRTVGPVALLTAIFYLNFAARVVLAPLLPPIEADLGIGHGEAGSLFLFVSLGYVVGLLGCGAVSAVLTHRRTIVVSALSSGAALLWASNAGSLWGLRAGAVVLGVASGLYLPSGIATLTSLVTPTDWGKALALHELAPNLAFVTAPLVVEALLQRLPWRGVLAAVGLAALAAGVAFAVVGRGGTFRGQAPSLGAVAELASQRSFWILSALFGLGLGASLGVYTMMPLYLVADLGMERGWANSLVAMSRASGLAVVFLAGWLTDRLGPVRTIVLALGACGLSTVALGLVSGGWVVPLVFLQPLLIVCFFPAGFAALSRLGPLAVTFAVPAAVLVGGGLFPTFIGALGARGAFGAAFVLVGVLLLGAAALARGLRLPA